MNIKITKKILEKGLNKINKAITQNPALTSLKGIKFSVSNEKIVLIASDGLLSIKETIKVNEEIKVLNVGELLVPGKMFIEVIKKQSNEIELTTEGNSLNITSSGSSMNINLLELEDYPRIDFDLIGEELIVDAKTFRNAIKEVSFAASENDKRIILSGVNLIAKNNRLRISSTDSYRLATTKIDIVSNNNFNITILARNIKDFIPSTIDGEVKIQVDENKINLNHESTLIQSRLIDGIYPELSKLIPKEYSHILKINAKELNDLMDKAIVVSSSEIKTVKLSLRNNEIIIESKNEEIGNSKVVTTNFTWEGEEEFDIAFDSKFVKEALKQFKDEVRIHFIGELKPFILTSASKPNLVQLVLPHRGY